MNIKSLIIEINVIPSSKSQKLILDKSGKLKCYLKNNPEKGLANKELIKFLSFLLDIKQSEIEIITGLTSKKKRIKINKDIRYDQFLNKVGFDCQIKI